MTCSSSPSAPGRVSFASSMFCQLSQLLATVGAVLLLLAGGAHGTTFEVTTNGKAPEVPTALRLRRAFPVSSGALANMAS